MSWSGWVRDHGGSALASCAVHAVLLFGTTSLMLQPARYEVEAGTGGIEVSLIAAPLPPAGSLAVPAPMVPPKVEEVLAAPASADDWVLDPVTPDIHPEGISTAEPPAIEEPPDALRQASAVYGDGSSPGLGIDPTTLYLTGGAASGTGGRRKNPAPPYPYAAIQQQQEGLVLLQAVIDHSGRPLNVEVVESSGFPLLDQSALRTIRRWKFDAAHIGFLPVQSKILIPIRFVLDERRAWRDPS